MNLLLQGGLPYDIDGIEISPDFRNMLQMELILADEELTDIEKTVLALEQLYPESPTDIGKAVDGLMWFYHCGERPSATEADKKGGGIQAYDFNQDASYIFAAFYSAYGISLTTTDFLHWWEFMALFESLPEDTMIKKIMHYRVADIRKVPKYEKKHYEEMKKHYSLKRKATTKKKSLRELEQQSIENVNKRFEAAAKAQQQAERGG